MATHPHQPGCVNTIRVAAIALIWLLCLAAVVADCSFTAGIEAWDDALKLYRWAASSAAFATAAAFLSYVAGTFPRKPNRRVGAVFFLLWTLGIPFFFYLDFYLFLRLGPPEPAFSREFERLRYGQELGRNFWLAFAAVIYFYFFGKHAPGGAE